MINDNKLYKQIVELVDQVSDMWDEGVNDSELLSYVCDKLTTYTHPDYMSSIEVAQFIVKMAKLEKAFEHACFQLEQLDHRYQDRSEDYWKELCMEEANK